MDPIADMLIMIKNGNRALKESVSLPYSKFKSEVASCLVKEGYLKSANQKSQKGHSLLFIELAYDNNNPKIKDLKRISKPSKRVYLGVKEIRPVKNGYGAVILSTPKGVMTGKEARKEMVGGEVLFTIY